MKKTIEKKVRYIQQINISEPDRDNIEPICYLNVFQDLGTSQLFGWKEYDYMRTKANLKSNDWKLRDKMWVAFVPKPEQILHYGEPITIVQRLKKYDN
jgi:hypothetical protein